MMESETGPVDPVLRWHVDHSNFARLLDCLEVNTAAIACGETPNYTLMIDILTYLRRYPDRYHHPREDEALSRLAARDPVAAAQVADLARAHGEMAAAGGQLLEQLEEALGDVVFSRPALSSALAAYIGAYREHIRREESEIMPRAAALLTPSDWNAIAGAHASGPDPLFGDKFDARYRDLRNAIAIEGGEASE
jgi:hemerythrin-like domain-containing protein